MLGVNLWMGIHQDGRWYKKSKAQLRAEPLCALFHPVPMPRPRRVGDSSLKNRWASLRRAQAE
jgi:hypothetical protein